MSKHSKTPKWLMPAILATGAIALFAKSAGASQKQAPSNVQTATVGNRVYSVARLGQGTYLVTLISTAGVIERAPVSYTFNQSGVMGTFGDAGKVAQLRADLNAMNVNFRDTGAVQDLGIGNSAAVEGAVIGGSAALLLLGVLKS